MQYNAVLVCRVSGPHCNVIIKRRGLCLFAQPAAVHENSYLEAPVKIAQLCRRLLNAYALMN